MKKIAVIIFTVISILIIIVALLNYESRVIVSDFQLIERSYDAVSYDSVIDILKHRVEVEPFNLVATVIFFLAIIHAICTGYFIRLSKRIEKRFEENKKNNNLDKNSKSILAGLIYFIGEVEVVFGIWTIVLGIAITSYYDFATFTEYLERLHFNEPIFIVVVMVIASSRPILRLFEFVLRHIVKILGESVSTWWFVILTIGPLLGSLITEPAAMTVSAHLLSEKVFSINPSERLKYTSLALLFINVSIGGSLTNFAAPPILMVAESWEWSTGFMFTTFGWKTIIAITLSTLLYYFFLSKDFRLLKKGFDYYQYKRFIQKKFISKKELEESFDELCLLVNENTGFMSEMEAYGQILKQRIKDIAKDKLSDEDHEELDMDLAIDEKFERIQEREFKRIFPGLIHESKRPMYMDPEWDFREDEVPGWIVAVHVMFLIWTVLNAHNAILFLGGFLFYLGFIEATSYYQNRLDLKPPILVAFFLSGLIIHGSLQSWWISPVLANLSDLNLNITAILLTAFNDNAALTYLATLVPGFTDGMKYALVAGALTGGGLTIIANAPNPIGVSILKKNFKSGISPLKLLMASLVPTIITALVFYVLK